MSQEQDAPPRERSAFVAGFLSLIFPGLGHAYARAWKRAILFAALPFILLSLLAGTYLSYGPTGMADLISSQMLVAILVGNIVAYLYRIIAAVDAWRVVSFTNRYEHRVPRSPVLDSSAPALRVLSVAGLAAVCLVMGGVHAAVAFYDSQAITLDQNIHREDDLNFPTPNPSASDSADATGSASPGTPEPTSDLPSASADPSETASPPPEWNGYDRLNILLIGSDKRPAEGTWNTDTLIVVSIDPQSHQVALFSLPRDISGVPLPPGPARNFYGGTWNRKINALFTEARGHPDRFPGGGYKTLKNTLGYLYGIPIHFYVEVDFNGFKKVVDALGGVTINVQKPVVDDYYPGDTGHLRVYIPTGVQHMTGAEALIYARSRHGSSDYDRGARQQRVLLSLRQQADLSTLARPEVISALVSSVGNAVKTDFPLNKIGAALRLASQIDITSVRSFVFGPVGGYAVDHWPTSSDVTPNVANIRRAVRSAFTFDAADQKAREAVANEGATVWVLDGEHSGQADALAGYLEFRGLAASAPGQKVTGSTPPNTIIKVYNGAEANLPNTISLLQDVFGVKIQLVNDPKVKADVTITTGVRTPTLAAPVLGGN
jgi:LCP family protein required for cell wall assembly